MHEHGVTFSSGNIDAFTLENAVPGQIQNAQVQATQLVLRSIIGHTAATRSVQGGKQAFMSATKFLVENMLRSITKKLEIELFYGQVGYATLAVMGASSVTIPIPAAQWAPGIWAGAEKMPIEIRDSAGANPVSRTVMAVDFENKTITVDTAYQAAAGDVIWHKGAYGNEFAGLHKILTNTSTLFEINAATYSLWKGNSYNVDNAALSFQVIQDGIAKGVEKGLDKDVVVFVNPRGWADLLTEQAALRMYDSSYSSSTAEKGSKEIKFHSQNGMVEIVPSIYVKEGFSYVVSTKDFVRIGSSDISFKRAGGDEFFRDLENAHGYELRCSTDQALFTFSPAHNVLLTNINNEA